MNALSSVSFFLVTNLFIAMLFILWARLFIRYFAIGTFHPFSQTVYTLTAPVIAPIQKHLTRSKSARGRYDLACLILLIFCELFKFATLNILFLNHTLSLSYILIYTAVDLVIQPCKILFYAIIIRSLLSWFSPHSHNPLTSLLFLITEPILRKIRQVLPTLGALDLSPIVAILALKSIEIFASAALPIPITF